MGNENFADFRIYIAKDKMNLIKWVAQKKGYDINNTKRRGGHKKFISDLTVNYCKNYYIKYKQQKEAEKQNEDSLSN